MDKVKIYRFRSYDIHNDTMKTSSRWGTRDAIKDIAHGEILEDTGKEVEASVVQSDIIGMTERDFDPEPGLSFQIKVR